MNIPRKSAFVLLVAALPLLGHAAVTASLNRNQVATGESVQLVLQHDGQTDTQPDLSPLAQDFRIMGTASGSSVQIINGKVSAKSQITVELIPNHDGQIQIPSLHWGGDTTQAVALTVGGKIAPSQPNVAAAGESGQTFFDVKLDHKPIYANGTILLNVRLYTDQALSQAALDFPANADVQVQQIGADRQYNETRDGRDYQVVERQYVLLPQRSGKITLNGPVLDAQVLASDNDDPFDSDSFFKRAFSNNPFAGMFGSRHPLHIQGKQIELDALPRPLQVKPQDWLPATNMSLSTSANDDAKPIRAGEPLTLHLHLAAENTVAANLPDLAALLSLPPGIKIYPDQAKLDTKVSGGRLIATRDQDIALVAGEAGRYSLPALHIPFWDVDKNTQGTVTLPARNLDVLAAGVASTPSVVDTNSAAVAANPEASSKPSSLTLSGTPWRWISVGLLTFWIATLGIWWRTARPGKPKAGAERQEPHSGKPTSCDNAMRGFQRAATSNDAQAARKHLLAWAEAKWPDDPPAGLRALASKLQDGSINYLIRDLDRACYKGTTWNGRELAEAIGAWSEPVARTGAKTDVPELYA